MAMDADSQAFLQRVELGGALCVLALGFEGQGQNRVVVLFCGTLIERFETSSGTPAIMIKLGPGHVKGVVESMILRAGPDQVAVCGEAAPEKEVSSDDIVLLTEVKDKSGFNIRLPDLIIPAFGSNEGGVYIAAK